MNFSRVIKCHLFSAPLCHSLGGEAQSFRQQFAMLFPTQLKPRWLPSTKHRLMQELLKRIYNTNRIYSWHALQTFSYVSHWQITVLQDEEKVTSSKHRCQVLRNVLLYSGSFIYGWHFLKSLCSVILCIVN